MVQRFGHVRRHPLCPACGYNLVATVAAEGRVCPECGLAFELHELDREVLPDDWTAVRGLRRCLRMLALRSIVALVAWTLLAWLVVWLVGLTGSVPVVALLGLAMAVGGGMVGHVLAGGLHDQTGVQPWLLLVLAVVPAWVVIAVGALSVRMFADAGTSQVLIAVVAGLFATLWIVRDLFFDDY